MEQEDRSEGYCQFAELCSEAGDGLGRPESEKVGVPPEALLRYDFGCRLIQIDIFTVKSLFGSGY